MSKYNDDGGDYFNVTHLALFFSYYRVMPCVQAQYNTPIDGILSARLSVTAERMELFLFGNGV